MSTRRRRDYRRRAWVVYRRGQLVWRFEQFAVYKYEHGIVHRRHLPKGKQP